MTAVRTDTCVRHLRAACAELPETMERPGGERGRHIAFTVRGRTFAYFTDGHHGDWRLALVIKTRAGEQEVLVAADPERFFVPPYLGHRGWVGLWLDGSSPDWDEVESFWLCAPRSLDKVVSG